MSKKNKMKFWQRQQQQNKPALPPVSISNASNLVGQAQSLEEASKVAAGALPLAPTVALPDKASDEDLRLAVQLARQAEETYKKLILSLDKRDKELGAKEASLNERESALRDKNSIAEGKQKEAEKIIADGKAKTIELYERESKIVNRMIIIGVMLAIICLITLKLR